jgi:surfactin family lipopeptide synthetase A
VESDKKYMSPLSQLGMDIVAIWEKILDRHPIGVTVDFYELGGNSLKALRILAEVEKELGIRLPLAAFPKTNTVQKMASYLGDQVPWTHLTALQPRGTRYPLFFVPPSTRTGIIFNNLAKHLGEDQPFYVLEYAG